MAYAVLAVGIKPLSRTFFHFQKFTYALNGLFVLCKVFFESHLYGIVEKTAEHYAGLQIVRVTPNANVRKPIKTTTD